MTSSRSPAAASVIPRGSRSKSRTPSSSSSNLSRALTAGGLVKTSGQADPQEVPLSQPCRPNGTLLAPDWPRTRHFAFVPPNSRSPGGQMAVKPIESAA